jgi:transcriptional regulator with XRE-family HTH domain
MPGLLKQVGARIRKLRETKGLSQEVLAELSGLHRTYIGLVERGQRNLTLEALEALAEALGVEVAELFAGIEHTSKSHKSATRTWVSVAADHAAQLATLRQLLVDAKLTDSRQYEMLYRANRKKES